MLSTFSSKYLVKSSWVFHSLFSNFSINLQFLVFLNWVRCDSKMSSPFLFLWPEFILSLKLLSDYIYQVNDPNLVVADSYGKHIETQYVTMDNTTSSLRNFYLKAYGFPSIQVPRYWLHFQVSVPPLGWSTYFIASATGIGKHLILFSPSTTLLKTNVISSKVDLLKRSTWNWVCFFIFFQFTLFISG
jgi:hypothetical protein